MRILIVAGFFPPHAPNSATRAPAFARHLLSSGHEVRVLGAHNTRIHPVLAHNLPEEIVTFAPVIEARELAPRKSDHAGPAKPWTRISASALAFFGVPEQRIGWLPYATALGRRIARDWHPDLIFATSPPAASLLVASSLSKKLGVPWVAEFRDLWTDHPYYDRKGLLARFERWLERRTLNTASGIVTVTEGWAAQLRDEYRQPVICAMNGYDPNDFSDVPVPPPTDGPLTLVYGGGLYNGKRDPTPLFKAIKSLGWTKDDVLIRFFVGTPAEIEELAREHGISDCVTVEKMISRAELLKIQQESDILLLLRWDDPGEDHVLAGKLFEYAGCRRPILSVGRTVGEAAEIIRAYRLGAIGTDPDNIAGHLKRWQDEKQSGGVPAPCENPPEVLARVCQFNRLERFLRTIINDPPLISGNA